MNGNTRAIVTLKEKKGEFHMAWSSVVGSLAAKIAGNIAKESGADEKATNNVKALATGIVGGTTAVLTGDVIGGAMVAYKMIKYAQNEKPHIHPAITGLGIVARLAMGDVDIDPNDYTT
jgi:hypothetical protein